VGFRRALRGWTLLGGRDGEMVDVVVLLERTAEARTTGQPTMRARELHERRAGGAERMVAEKRGDGVRDGVLVRVCKGRPKAVSGDLDGLRLLRHASVRRGLRGMSLLVRKRASRGGARAC
jgi:hypothetical protein